MNIEVPMKLDKQTKNTHVYRAENPNASIETLYIRKQAFQTKAPDVIKVTVEWV